MVLDRKLRMWKIRVRKRVTTRASTCKEHDLGYVKTRVLYELYNLYLLSYCIKM